jgi:uncharacterized OB-fold protein
MARHYLAKSCALCGRTFTPTAGVQKYCVRCRSVAKRNYEATDEWKTLHRRAARAYQKRKARKGICQQCGKGSIKLYLNICNECGVKQKEQTRQQRGLKAWEVSGLGRPPLVR